jgi:hypothetical protein
MFRCFFPFRFASLAAARTLATRPCFSAQARAWIGCVTGCASISSLTPLCVVVFTPCVDSLPLALAPHLTKCPRKGERARAHPARPPAQGRAGPHFFAGSWKPTPPDLTSARFFFACRSLRCQIWSSFWAPYSFLLLAGYENLTAPNAIMQS